MPLQPISGRFIGRNSFYNLWTLDTGHGSRDKVYRYRDNKNARPTKNYDKPNKAEQRKCIVRAYSCHQPTGWMCRHAIAQTWIMSFCRLWAPATLHRIFTGYNLKVIKQCSMRYVSSSPPPPPSLSSLALLFPRTELALGRCRYLVNYNCLPLCQSTIAWHFIYSLDGAKWTWNSKMFAFEHE